MQNIEISHCNSGSLSYAAAFMLAVGFKKKREMKFDLM
jgi:hypothetical protein